MYLIRKHPSKFDLYDDINLHIEWQPVVCPGNDIEGHSYKPMTKVECKAKCNLLRKCTFAVHGGSYGQTSSLYGWWVDRCVLRNNLRESCSNGTIEEQEGGILINTYIKEGKNNKQLLITNNNY